MGETMKARRKEEFWLLMKFCYVCSCAFKDIYFMSVLFSYIVSCIVFLSNECSFRLSKLLIYDFPGVAVRLLTQLRCFNPLNYLHLLALSLSP